MSVVVTIRLYGYTCKAMYTLNNVTWNEIIMKFHLKLNMQIESKKRGGDYSMPQALMAQEGIHYI